MTLQLVVAAIEVQVLMRPGVFNPLTLPMLACETTDNERVQLIDYIDGTYGGEIDFPALQHA